VSNNKEELSFYDLRTLKMLKQIKDSKVDINGFQWSNGPLPSSQELSALASHPSEKMLLVHDHNGTVTIYNGETLHPSPVHTMLTCHQGHCYALAIDPLNRYFATGGSDSLIGLWDMSDFSLIKTISNNDAKVMAVKINFDGSLVASLCEDDINKKYLIEVYDFNYDEPMTCSISSGGQTIFAHRTDY
jgi:THO complex subunit 3